MKLIILFVCLRVTKKQITNLKVNKIKYITQQFRQQLLHIYFFYLDPSIYSYIYLSVFSLVREVDVTIFVDAGVPLTKLPPTPAMQFFSLWMCLRANKPNINDYLN